MKHHSRVVARSRKAKKSRYRSKRKLVGAWTVERTIDLRAQHGLEIEQEITRVLLESLLTQ